jgi:hypothetical protein
MSFTISDLVVKTVEKAGVRRGRGDELIDLAKTNVTRRSFS